MLGSFRRKRAARRAARSSEDSISVGLGQGTTSWQWATKCKWREFAGDVRGSRMGKYGCHAWQVAGLGQRNALVGGRRLTLAAATLHALVSRGSHDRMSVLVGGREGVYI